MIAGLGMDVCSVARIRRLLEGPHRERFVARVYTEAEAALCGRRGDAPSAYAARFAAKEALVKALGAPPGVRWREMEVVRTEGPPSFRLSGTALRAVAGRRVWLAITHDAGVAAATVVIEGEACPHPEGL